MRYFTALHLTRSGAMASNIVLASLRSPKVRLVLLGWLLVWLGVAVLIGLVVGRILRKMWGRQ